MRHARTRLLSAASAFRPYLPLGAIEWEDMPSLVALVAERKAAAHGDVQRLRASAGQAWDETRPSEFDAASDSQPFREPISGLAIREVCEPDVFRHFFGA